jgi:hypothetical protein
MGTPRAPPIAHCRTQGQPRQALRLEGPRLDLLRAYATESAFSGATSPGSLRETMSSRASRTRWNGAQRLSRPSLAARRPGTKGQSPGRALRQSEGSDGPTLPAEDPATIHE